MLTMHTVDLVGCLNDALPFVALDKDDTERRCVELRWDGELFHTSADSHFHAGVSSWSPDDPPEKDVQDELEVKLGSDDGPWACILDIEDVDHLLKTVKPAKGLEYVPLFIDWDGQFLTVRRSKQTRVPGLTLAYDGMTHAFPDVRRAVVEAASRLEDVKEIQYNGSFLAAFGKVRTRGGCMKLTFGGARGTTIVEVGHRFVGLIQPVRPAEDPS